MNLDVDEKLSFSMRCNLLLQQGLTIYEKNEEDRLMDGKLRFIDLFAGIGGIRKGFEDENTMGVFSAEWDPHAAKTYEANYGEVPFGDITKIHEKDVPEHDVLLAGFPCQPFSNIGKRQGFAHETQGTLFFDVLRILKWHMPKMFLLENVPGILTIQNGETFKIIVSALEELGYSVFHDVLDAQNFGLPHVRRRVLIIGFHPNMNISEFEFPKGDPDNKVPIKTILEKNVEGYTVSEHLQNSYLFKKDDGKPQLVDYDSDVQAKTLVASYHKIQRLTGTFVKDGPTGVRLLSELECKRLMGFPESFVIPVSRTQMYRQFGNSVAVPVIKAVADEMKKMVRGTKNEDKQLFMDYNGSELTFDNKKGGSQMSTYNIGEWSEYYVFLKILAERELTIKDIEERNYTVTKIYKEDKEYEIQSENKDFVLVREGAVEYTVPTIEVADGARNILKEFDKKDSSTFAIPSVDTLTKKLKLKNIKSPATSKGDLKLKIYDSKTSKNHDLEFSIKSLISGKPTLLNASNHTSVYFKPTHEVSVETQDKILEFKQIAKRIEYLESQNIKLEFSHMESDKFQRNVEMVDSQMPKLLSELFYASLFVKGKKMKKVVEYYSEKNGISEDYLSHKVKDMLVSIALGMVPKAKWSGLDSATGGYVVVQKNGEVICYDLSNRNQLREYLYQNTAFDTPSTSRYKAGVFSEIDHQQLFKLTIQIRFC